jgi:hypothetical protein
MLNADAENFLWRLLSLGLLVDDAQRARDWVASYHDREIELSAGLEALVIEYWASADRAVLLKLAHAALQGFSLSFMHRTRLTAYLFVNDCLDEKQAFAFLDFEGVRMEDLYSSVRRVADVCWLLREDSKAGVMESGDDDLLSEALRALADESLPTID